MNRKSIIKNISYSFLANIISLILGIVATFFFPKFLDITGYGYYQLYIFYTGYLIITALGLADGVQLKTAGKEYKNLDYNELNALFWLSTIIQVIIYITLFLVSLIVINNTDKQFALVCACIVGFIAHPRYYLYTLLQGVSRLKEYSHIVITERSISIVLSVFALLLGLKDFRLMIILDVIGRIISFIIAIYFCKEIVFKRPTINITIVKKMISYTVSGAMILLAMQTSSIVVGINRYGIEQRWGIEEFSKISLAIALSNMVLRCVNSISIVMFPTLRNIDKSKLPSIYKKINAILMSTIFIFMCLFKPVCYLIGIWLPKYADSLKYSILLLPICVYECKYSLLINTNLKTLNKEKTIGLINTLSIIIAFASAFISIVILKNMEFAIIGILFSLSIRSMFGEYIIGKEYNISIVLNIISEVVLSIAFIICTYYFNGAIFQAIYLTLVAVYIYIERYEVIDCIKLLKLSKN